MKTRNVNFLHLFHSQNLGMTSSLYTYTHIQNVYIFTYTAYTHTHMYTHNMVNDQMNPTRKSNVKLVNGDPIFPLLIKGKNPFSSY